MSATNHAMEFDRTKPIMLNRLIKASDWVELGQDQMMAPIPGFAKRSKRGTMGSANKFI
jgi:hypothetical protein